MNRQSLKEKRAAHHEMKQKGKDYPPRIELEKRQANENERTQNTAWIEQLYMMDEAPQMPNPPSWNDWEKHTQTQLLFRISYLLERDHTCTMNYERLLQL